MRFVAVVEVILYMKEANLYTQHVDYSLADQYVYHYSV